MSVGRVWVCAGSPIDGVGAGVGIRIIVISVIVVSLAPSSPLIFSFRFVSFSYIYNVFFLFER